MQVAEAKFRINVEPGIVTQGLWCTECEAPSMMAVPMMVVDLVGVTPIGTYVFCPGHSTEWEHVTEVPERR